MKKYLTEFIGTFFLVFTVGMVVINPAELTLAPLAIGSVLMVMIYAGGHISGGHYNPAVSLGVFLRGKLNSKDLMMYWVSQFIGSVIAAIVVMYLKSGATVNVVTPDAAKSVISEFIFTFALVFVVLNVATADETSGNSYFGLAIGFTVLVGAYSVGTISGGAFNPAVALGVTVMGLRGFESIWIYLVGNFAGGAVAALAFKVLHAETK